MSRSADRHPDNATGDFYVECDACISCEAPYFEAPDLMGRPASSPNNYGCFFWRQPSTPEETARACEAVAVSCVEAVRYSGKDPKILRTLYDRSAFASCDIEPTHLERQIIQHVKDNYRISQTHGVHWTYVRSDLRERTLVACCYGPYKHTLGLFAYDKATQQITIIHDDAGYRPKIDDFKRPKSRLS